jgi:hypothetical protein
LRPNGYHHKLLSLALLGLLLRVAVPAGYMPASVSGGWYLQLCPDGVPATVMAALSGHAHAHHQEHDGGDAGRSYVQCDLGTGLSNAVALQQPFGVSPSPAIDSPQLPAIVSRLEHTSLRAYRSRAPPSFISHS